MLGKSSRVVCTAVQAGRNFQGVGKPLGRSRVHLFVQLSLE